MCPLTVGKLRAVAALRARGARIALDDIGAGSQEFARLATLRPDVIKIDADLSARELLETLQGIEQRIGREPSDIRWGPRVVDLDILMFGDEKVSEPDLEIPHPRMKERRFVLIPLLEIEPDVADPWGTRYADSLDEAEGDVEHLSAF